MFYRLYPVLVSMDALDAMIRRRTHVLASGLLLAAACANAPVQEHAGPASPERPSAAAAATIRPEDFRARIGFLASDALLGRDTPSPGLEIAAEYIASEFRSAGLEPLGDEGGFLQRYTFAVRTLRAAEASLQLTARGAPVRLRSGSDFFAVAGSDPASGEVVFAGRAAALPELAAGTLAGRVALVDLAGARLQDANRARGQLARAGASAMIVVLDAAATEEQVAEAAARVRPARGGAQAIPAAFVRRVSAAAQLERAGVQLDALAERAGEDGFRPLALPALNAALDAPAEEQVHRPPNVVGVLRGSDPLLRDTYLVVSAHFDHVGVGAADARGDSIFNGADDNASGTAAVLEMAEAFAALEARPARSVIFLAVSGEEKGLLGSAHFAENLPVARERVIANINIDMIGRNAPDSVVAIGQEYSSLGPLVQQVRARHPELGLTVAQDLWPQQRFFFRSDHYNFARQEIPAIFFFTGTHEDYHRASDEIDRIDFDKAARVTRLIFHLAHELANSPQAPSWSEAGLAEIRQLTR